MGFTYMGCQYHNSMDTMTYSVRADLYGKPFALRYQIDSILSRLFWVTFQRGHYGRFQRVLTGLISDLAHYGNVDIQEGCIVYINMSYILTMLKSRLKG